MDDSESNGGIWRYNRENEQKRVTAKIIICSAGGLKIQMLDSMKRRTMEGHDCENWGIKMKSQAYRGKMECKNEEFSKEKQEEK